MKYSIVPSLSSYRQPNWVIGTRTILSVWWIEWFVCVIIWHISYSIWLDWNGREQKEYGRFCLLINEDWSMRNNRKASLRSKIWFVYYTTLVSDIQIQWHRIIDNYFISFWRDLRLISCVFMYYYWVMYKYAWLI